MASQRNVILQLQKDVATLRKELAEFGAKIDELSSVSEEDDGDEPEQASIQAQTPEKATNLEEIFARSECKPALRYRQSFQAGKMIW